MEPGSIADREMRIDYAPSPIGGQGQFTCADDQFRVYHSFNSQPFPQILASLSRPLEPLQHACKLFNTLTKSRKNIPCSRLARSVITVHAQRILIRGYRIKTIRPSTRRKSFERRYG